MILALNLEILRDEREGKERKRGIEIEEIGYSSRRMIQLAV